MAITHTKQSTVADSTDSTFILPSDWNAGHSGTLGTSQGGLAVANSSGWSLTTTSTGPTGFKITANTTVTFPTSGTLITNEVTSLTALSSAAALTAVGTIDTGTWSATTISAAKGGTGIANNAAATLARTGNFALGLTLTAASTVTLPTSGTLITNETIIGPAVGGTGIANNASATLARTGSFPLGLTLTAASTVTLPTSGTILGTDISATLGVGYKFTAYKISTSGISTAFTPDAANGNYQYGTLSTAANVWSAPAADCAIDILTLNSTNGGATITTSGYNVGGNTGDAQSTSSGAYHIVSIRRINSISTYTIKALQ